MLPRLRTTLFVLVALLSAYQGVRIRADDEKPTPPTAKSKAKMQRKSRSSSLPALPDGESGLTEEKRLQARRAIQAVIGARPKAEPLPKPPTWTEREYKLAHAKALLWQGLMDSPKALSESYWIKAKIVFGGNSEAGQLAGELLPESCGHWLRECWMQALKIDADRLDNLIVPFPYLREVKDETVRTYLRRRASWQERKELFAKLSVVTHDKRAWSLHHPFDNLDRAEMVRVTEAAVRAKEVFSAILKGEKCQPMKKEEFDLLVEADQHEYLYDLLASPEERRAAEAERERQRQAAVEAARQQEVAAQQQEVIRQRQMRIDKEEKEAKKLLRAALLLNTRSGFEKQVRERLQQIIDKYPDTPSAKKAQRQLEKMSK